MKIIHLHIGLQKTGTSSVQAQLIRRDGLLSEAGIDHLPSVVAPSLAHHNAAWDAGRHKRHKPGLPGVEALVAAAHASPRDRLFVSSEDFSILEPGHVTGLAEALRSFDVRPILVLRNQVDFAESIFAQASKTRLPGSFESYLERLEGEGRLAFDRIVDRWDQAFGSDKLTLLAYEEHDDIAAAICRVLGIEPGPTQALRRNKSFNERFVAASQGILRQLAAVDSRGAPVVGLVGERTYVDVTRAGPLSRAMMAIAAQDPRFAGKPVFMSHDEAQVLLDRMAAANRRIERLLPLPPAWFAPDPTRREPLAATPEDEDLLKAGLDDASIPGLIA